MAEYVGCDISKEEAAPCVLERARTDLVCTKVPTDWAALFRGIKVLRLCLARIVLHKRMWLKRSHTNGCKEDNIPKLCLVLWEAETFRALCCSTSARCPKRH